MSTGPRAKRAVDLYDTTLDIRRIRADALTAFVWNIVGKHIDYDARRDAQRELLAAFHEAGVDIVTDANRAEAGLPPRDRKGWTADDLRVLEYARIKAMLAPMPPLILTEESPATGSPSMPSAIDNGASS